MTRCVLLLILAIGKVVLSGKIKNPATFKKNKQLVEDQGTLQKEILVTVKSQPLHNGDDDESTKSTRTDTSTRPVGHATQWAWSKVVTLAALGCLVLVREVWAALGQGELRCQTSRRSIQMVSLLYQVALLMDFSSLIPGSYDVADFLGIPGMSRAMISGCLVSTSAAFYPIGATLASWSVGPTNSGNQPRARLLALVAVLAVAAADFVLSNLLLSPPFRGAPLLCCLLTCRCVVMLAGGLAMTVVIMAYQVTPRAELVALSIAEAAAVNLGLCCGPVLCAMMFPGSVGSPAQVPILESSVLGAAMTSYSMGLVWLFFGLLIALTIPVSRLPLCDLPGSKDVLVTQDRATDWEKLGTKTCEKTFCLGLLFGMERALTVAAIEVSTSLILETRYKWSVQAIGCATGAMAASTVVLGIVALAFRHAKLVKDSDMMLMLTLLGMLSCVFLFDLGICEGPWLFLTCDAILYTVAFNANGIADGIATEAAMDDTFFSAAWYQVYKSWFIPISRCLAPPVARLLVDALGWNAYVAAQCLICGCGCLTAFKLAASMQHQVRHSKDNW